MTIRIFDLIFSSILIVILSPIIIVIVLLLLFTEPRHSPFYRQTRVGLKRQQFTLLKFRSMVPQNLVPMSSGQLAEPKGMVITPLGKYLRRFSLDELPQLYNVLAGHMSLVGPRPHPLWVSRVVEARSRRYWRRYNVKPGLTGLAQLLGNRGAMTDEAKIKHRIACDLLFVKKLTPWYYLKILVATALKPSILVGE